MKTEAELQEIAKEIIDRLRPYHLRIRDIRYVLKFIEQALEFVTLQEKTKDQ